MESLADMARVVVVVVGSLGGDPVQSVQRSNQLESSRLALSGVEIGGHSQPVLWGNGSELGRQLRVKEADR